MERGLETTVVPSGGAGWIVKPSLNTSTVLRLGLLCAVVILLTLRALLDPARTARAATLDVLIIGAAGFVLVVHFRNSKAIGDGDTITKVNWLGRSVSYPVSGIKHADRFRSSASRYLVFAGPDGRQLFRVAGIYWDFDQLDQLCDKVGIPETGGYDEGVGGCRSTSMRGQIRTGWRSLDSWLPSSSSSSSSWSCWTARPRADRAPPSVEAHQIAGVASCGPHLFRNSLPVQSARYANGPHRRHGRDRRHAPHVAETRAACAARVRDRVDRGRIALTRRAAPSSHAPASRPSGRRPVASQSVPQHRAPGVEGRHRPPC